MFIYNAVNFIPKSDTIDYIMIKILHFKPVFHELFNPNVCFIVTLS